MKFYTFYANLRNHLTERMTAPVRYQFYKISKKIQQWNWFMTLSKPSSVGSYFPFNVTGMEQWFFPRCINEMVSIPFPPVANSLCYSRENLARASFPYLLTMNVISTNFWTRVNFQDATTRKMALCAHANDVTHRAQCTCAWRPWGWCTAIKFILWKKQKSSL